MASDDVYLRRDVYAADQRALIAEIRLGNNEVLKVLDQFRAEMNDFRTEFNTKLEQVRTEFSTKLEQFKAEVNDRFNKVDNRFTVVDGKFATVDGKFSMVEARFGMVDARFDRLESQLTALIGRIDGLERRIDSLGNLMMAGIGFISMLIGLLVFVMPISRFMRRFWKPKPAITLEQIEALIDAKLSAK